MARALANLRCTATSARTPTLQRWTLVCVRLSNEEFVCVESEVVLGVRNSGVEHLLDGGCGLAVRELEHHTGLTHGEATNKIQHASHLVGRLADMFCLGARVHRCLTD